MAPQRIHERFRTADGLRCIGVQSTDNRGCGRKGHGNWAGMTLKVKGLQLLLLGGFGS